MISVIIVAIKKQNDWLCEINFSYTHAQEGLDMSIQAERA